VSGIWFSRHLQDRVDVEELTTLEKHEMIARIKSDSTNIPVTAFPTA